ncbi:MAG: hypothetical protein FJX66_04210 [Alphaproteobacteria bacterium]|nr:hypothetical protein [Alphaproteobacteria bacterium]
MTSPARFLAPDQLVLPIAHAPAFSRADFVVAPSNEAAVRLIDTWPDWTFGGSAVIVGPPSSGKSHLAQIFSARSGAEIVPAVSLAGLTTGVFDRGALVIENAEAIADERAVLHCINALAEVGGHLLLTAREPPSRWPIKLPDLASRLRQVFTAEITAPDDALVSALLVKLFSDRQVSMSPEVIRYLGARIERSHAGIQAIVERLDRAALKSGRSVGLALARAVLEGE